MSLPQDTGEPASDRIAPLEEQRICVECGFCCDGTLFLHAHLNPGERGHLPEKIESAVYSKDGRDYFRLPCGYFDRKCTIYDKKKADVCFDYRCQLLKDYAAGKVSAEEALEIVREAGRIRAELFAQFRIVAGGLDGINFMAMLREIGKMNESFREGGEVLPEWDMFVARCNIFEALLIRHFWSAGEFEKLMMPETKVK